MSRPTKAQNPDMDFGFYATFPRIVRTGYKDVSPVQKWLYVCLKDLAGDDGTCYRTIRALVEETGLSAGMISESILVLHKAGLIHAEKKKRSTGGKEVWHISIVDIWKKNGEAHPTKRSPSEQTVPYSDVQSANVHHMNDNTTECSHAEQECSPHEQECSLSETEVITITRPVSKNITEARTESTYSEQSANATDVSPIGSTAHAPVSQFVFQIQGAERFYYHDFCIHEQDRGINDGLTLLVKQLNDVPMDAECSICYKPIHGPHGYCELPALEDEPYAPDFTDSQARSEQDSVADESDYHSQLSTAPVDKPAQARAKLAPKQDKPASEPKPKRTRTKAAPQPLAFTAEGRKVYDAWCSLFKSPPRTAEKTVDCANDLYARLVPWCKELKMSCAALLDEIQKHLYKTDTNGFYDRGVTLCDIDRDFEKWQSAKTQEMERAKKPAPAMTQRLSKSGQTRTVEIVPNMAHAGDHLNPALYDDEVAYVPRSAQGGYHA